MPVIVPVLAFMVLLAALMGGLAFVEWRHHRGAQLDAALRTYEELPIRSAGRSDVPLAA
jgi:hypothetical protein